MLLGYANFNQAIRNNLCQDVNTIVFIKKYFLRMVVLNFKLILVKL